MEWHTYKKILRNVWQGATFTVHKNDIRMEIVSFLSVRTNQNLRNSPINCLVKVSNQSGVTICNYCDSGVLQGCELGNGRRFDDRALSRQG